MKTDLAAAYAACGELARSHYENFPVASRMLPADMRPHVAAVYAFARIADDFADEGSRPAADRVASLDDWGARLDRALDAGLGAAAPGLDAGTDPAAPHAFVFVALRNTIETFRLPRALFHDLLSAFRQDVSVTRYETWHDVLDYCRRSANPVGRLVLRIAGYDRPELDAASDAVCTALQLTNFWQDLDIDWRRGRLYVPGAIWRPAGARPDDLSSRRMTPEWRAALREAAHRTRELFAAGRGICDGVRGRLRWELRATWLGGTRILDKLEAADCNVFANRPTLTTADVPTIVWGTLFWARS